MKLNRRYKNTVSAAAAVVVLCSGSSLAQSDNPWAPYPRQQMQPAPTVPTAPQPPKYHQEAPIPGPANQTAPAEPSRFAPADLDQRLSTPPQGQTPYGYQPFTGQAPPNAPPNFGQPQGYYQGAPQGYPAQNQSINGPTNHGGYGGYGPPIIGNNSWGSAPRNNFFPFGF